ncbi:hypothetical protein BDQ17DRAFT_1353739 [Cyathus striatus]|nr:hypothetical protein BDQ17DRAFT_1353739 [Cyathus striatus]
MVNTPSTQLTVNSSAPSSLRDGHIILNRDFPSSPLSELYLPPMPTQCSLPPTHRRHQYHPFRCTLPIEILDLVINCLHLSELIPILVTNSTLHYIALRNIYSSISKLSPTRLVSCLRTISTNSHIPPLVRSLEISIDGTPTSNFYRLVQRVLQRTTRLISLHIELPKSHNPVWLLDGCACALKRFTTSMRCSSPLAQFLDTQPGITDLVLRGFPGGGSNTMSFLHPGLSITSFSYPANKGGFELQSSSLPNLTMFSAIHAGPEIVKSVVTGRPVKGASIPLFRDGAALALDALSGTAVPLERISIISFDPDVVIFPEVALRFPQLEALHIVSLLCEYNKELLVAWAPLLSQFKCLKYITFMSSSASLSLSTRADEGSIAKLWHKACPTLQTIILPRGRVWFQGQNQWNCLDDDEREERDGDERRVSEEIGDEVAEVHSH